MCDSACTGNHLALSAQRVNWHWHKYEVAEAVVECSWERTEALLEYGALLFQWRDGLRGSLCKA